jgi:hypothetical protein
MDDFNVCKLVGDNADVYEKTPRLVCASLQLRVQPGHNRGNTETALRSNLVGWLTYSCLA